MALRDYRFQPPFGTPINLNHPLTKGLIAYWPLSESGGANGKDLTPYNNTLVSPNGIGHVISKNGRAYNWASASSQYMQVSASGILKDIPLRTGGMSVTFWSNMTEEAVNYWFITDNGGGVGQGWAFTYNNLERAKFLVQYSTTDFNLETGSSFLPVPPTGWIFVAATIIFADVNNSHLYVDGIEASSYTTTNSASGTYQTDDANMWIGRKGSTYIDGGMQDIRIYDRALKIREIREIFVNPWAIYNQPVSIGNVPAVVVTDLPYQPWMQRAPILAQ